jgi:hypothetical protein
MKTIMFDGEFPDFNMERELVLYCPLKFNYRAIDGIIVRIAPVGVGERRKCFMFPIQITVARKHSDSEAAFFKHWGKWKSSFAENNIDIEVEFLWITKEDPDTSEVTEENRDSRSGPMLKHPNYSTRNIPLDVVSPEISQRYKSALKHSTREISTTQAVSGLGEKPKPQGAVQNEPEQSEINNGREAMAGEQDDEGAAGQRCSLGSTAAEREGGTGEPAQSPPAGSSPLSDVPDDFDPSMSECSSPRLSDVPDDFDPSMSE